MRGLVPHVLRRLTLLLLLAIPSVAFANATVLLEDPFGSYGTMTQVGHSAVYLDRVCADTPQSLRLCNPGELGVVLSRYHRINHVDWLAIPVVAYLYAVPTLAEVPATIDSATELTLRDAYRHTYLQSIAPDSPTGQPPPGAWVETIGSAYDRRIQAFQFETTRAQDLALIDLLNDRPNRGHYNLAIRNCADFSGMIVNFYYPHTVHPNYLADLLMDTPRQVANSVIRLQTRTPAANLRVFTIPQVPGSLRRSHSAKGVMEGLLKTKRYFVAILIAQPYVAATVTVAYLTQGRSPHPPPDSIQTALTLFPQPAPTAPTTFAEGQ